MDGLLGALMPMREGLHMYERGLIQLGDIVLKFCLYFLIIYVIFFGCSEEEKVKESATWGSEHEV